MEIFFKTIAGILITLVLWIILTKHTKDMSLLLTLCVCVMVIVSALGFLQPILRFINKIQGIGDLDKDLISVLLKIVGIGIIAEFTMLICKDAGNEAMGKAVHILSTVFVLWMSIPVFEKLLSLLDKILGAV